MRDIKDRFSKLCIDKRLTFTSRATSPFSRGGKCDSAFRAIVRFWKGWWSGNGWCDNPSGSRPNFFGDSTSPLTRGGKNVVRSEGEASNPSGSRPNFFGRQHLTFDKGGKGVGDFRGIVRFWEGWVRRFICCRFLHCNRKIGYCAVPD